MNEYKSTSHCKYLCQYHIGKFISTIGNVSAETIKKYIEEQKGK